jgi:hypothetical protein
MRLISIIIIAILFLCNDFNTVNAMGMAKVTIKVVDEEENPVEDANVRICFHGGCLKKDAIKGKTDSKGLFVVSGSSSDGVTGGAVEKVGYYDSGYHQDFITWNLGMWQPWNKEIKVILRPKIKPVPMYVRDKWVTIPAVGKKVGFDLVKFDWVVPYGLGIVADLLIQVDRRLKNYDDFDSIMTMTFPNKFDGIQTFELDMGGDFGVGSVFRTPRYAPESGYQAKLITTISSKDLPVYRTKETFNFIRVRSELDKNGKLKRAMYGKMKGRLIAEPRDSATAKIQLYYWLNPDYTRNMEFDTDRNLFSPLPRGEIDRWDP